MTCDEGLVENHFYRDLRGMDKGDFGCMWDEEQELLDYIASGKDPEADEAWEQFCDNDVYRLDLDPGVASTVAALAAIGACPVTSCAGGSGHFEQHPLVLFWGEQEHLDKVLAAAKEVEGIEVEGVGEPGILVYTHGDVSLMREFAQVLMR